MQENYLNDQFLLLLVVIKIKVLIFVSNGLLKQNILISVNRFGIMHHTHTHIINKKYYYYLLML